MPGLLFICGTNVKVSILTAGLLIHPHVISDSSKTCCKMELSFLKLL